MPKATQPPVEDRGTRTDLSLEDSVDDVTITEVRRRIKYVRAELDDMSGKAHLTPEEIARLAVLKIQVDEMAVALDEASDRLVSRGLADA